MKQVGPRSITGAYQCNDIEKLPRIKVKQCADMRVRRLVVVVVCVRLSQQHFIHL